MKHLLLVLLGFVSAGSLMAQYPGAGGRPGGRGRSIPQVGHFYGRIIDASSNKGIEAASVQLLQARFDTTTHKRKEVVVSGMLTRGNGDFSLENLPIFGSFQLKITAIGFKPYEKTIAFDLKAGQGQNHDMSQVLSAVDKDLGNIRLELDPKMLQSVTVTGSKPLVSLDIDKKVFNVEKNITSAGGTAEDVMKNVPSVSIDIDGNLSLRNGTPQLFVDGRPTTLTLDEIPADEIESVEVITNPSAKYDASGGTAGIINIVLKKNRKAGYNGSVRAGIDQRGKYFLGGDLNVKEGKINFFANAHYRQRKSITTGHQDRETMVSDPYTYSYETDNSTRDGYFMFGRTGFDYFIDNRNTLTLSGTFVKGHFGGGSTSNIYVDSLYDTPKTSYDPQFSNSAFEFRNKGAALSFKHNFAKAGKAWTADINYNKSNNSNNNLNLINYYYDQAGTNLKLATQNRATGSGSSDNLTIQTDYTNPLSEKTKLEAGARVQIHNQDNENDISRDGGNGILIKEPLLSSLYSNKQNVYAGYVTFTDKIGNFGYQIGLRTESSEYSGDVSTITQGGKDTVISYSNSFPVSLFPSIFLTQKLNHDQELQFNVTRRINRPNFFELSPFTDYSDSFNLSRGNPNLKPEFTYSFEISYEKTYQQNNTFLASVYYKYTNKLITSYQQKETNPVTGNENLINTYINANSSYVGGLELIDKQSVSNWWDLTTNLNLYTSRIKIDDPAIKGQGSIYSWFAKVNNQFKLPKNFSLQLSGQYRSKTVLPPGGSASDNEHRHWGGPQTTSQGFIRPTWGVDAAVKYDFLKEKRASLTLTISDIFRSDVTDVYSASTYSTQNSFRRRDPQFFRLNFSWRFGKFDVSLFKRKNMRNDMDNMQEGMQGMQQ